MKDYVIGIIVSISILSCLSTIGLTIFSGIIFLQTKINMFDNDRFLKCFWILCGISILIPSKEILEKIL